MGYQLGVDLGTTYTAAAVYRDGKSTIFPLGGRSASIPTVVHLREDETVLTGEAAVRRSITEPGRVAREFKRRLGDSAPIIVGGTPYSAEALLARMLKYVVAEVEKREGGAPEKIAVCHPANWGQYKIDLLNQAIRLAGIPQAKVELLTEPQAAAISYSTLERVEVGEIIAVYDLGGGTFDAAVLKKTDGGFEIMGRPEGIERLGGIDFDSAVFAHVSRLLGDSLAELDEDDPMAIAAVSRLRADCVDAKEALSSDTDTVIPVMLPNFQTEVRITRSEFEALIRPALSDSIDAMGRALSSAGVTPDQVSRVLLVGGSSRIPLIAQMVGMGLGRPVAVDAHPKHAIAVGAALAAATASGAASPAGAAAAAPATPAVPESQAPPTPPTPGPTSPAVAAPAAAAVPPPVSEPPSSAPAGPTPDRVPAAPTPEPVAASAPMPTPAPVREPAASVPDRAGTSAPPATKSGPNMALIGGGVLALLAVAGIVGFLVQRGGGDDVAGDTTTITTEAVTDETTETTSEPEDDPAEAETTTTTEPEEVIPDLSQLDVDLVLDVQNIGPQFDVSAAIDGSTVALTGVVVDDIAKTELVTSLEAIGATEVDVSRLKVLPVSERCTDAIQNNAHWVCLLSAELEPGGDLTIQYISDFGGDTFAINGGFHLHVFSGETDPVTAGASGAASTGGGAWQVWDLPESINTTAGNIGLSDTAESVCARIANPSHQLESLDSGQCVKLVRN